MLTAADYLYRFLLTCILLMLAPAIWAIAALLYLLAGLPAWKSHRG